MKRYLLASLISGLVYAALGCLFMHCLLPASIQQELWIGLRGVEGSLFQFPRRYAQDFQSGTIHQAYFIAGWGLIGMHVGIRIGFGFVTMAVFASLQRKRARFSAARIAALVFWLLAFVGFSLRMHFASGLRWAVAGLLMAWGLLETQIAAHLGALAWGRAAVGAA